MAGEVVDRDMGYNELMRDLADLAKSPVAVLVGVSGKTDSDMVVIAASNEFGTEDGHIPERSYLRSTVDNGRAEILDDLQDAVENTLKGKDIDTELGRVGEKWVGKVKETFRSAVPPKNAIAATIDGVDMVRKGRKLVPASVAITLIDQGRLRNSITWHIKREIF